MNRIIRKMVGVSLCIGIAAAGLIFGESTLAASDRLQPITRTIGDAYQQSNSPTATPLATMPLMAGMPGMVDATTTATPDTSSMTMGNMSSTMAATTAATMTMGNMIMPGMVLDSCANQPITTADQTVVDQLVAQVKIDAAPFADWTVAVAQGYTQTTAYPIPGKSGSWGPAHFLNTAYIVQDVLDNNPINPKEPGSLVYFRMPTGKMMLLGEMFLAPRGKGPCPGGGLTVWHNHTNLCFKNGTAEVVGFTDAQGNCRAGATNKSTMDMLHVWVFDNPDGPMTADLTKQDYTAAYLQCLEGSPWCH